MDPVPIGKLSSAEGRILLAVEASWGAPRSAVPGESLGLGKEIPFRAEVLRRLLLGLPLPVDRKGSERVVKVPESGITLQNLLVEKELSLRSACRPDGSALPPLTFERCIFLKRIHLSAARFRRLGFDDCRLSRLRGIGLHVEGGLNLRAIATCEGFSKWRTEKKTGAVERPSKTEKVLREIEPNESNLEIREIECVGTEGENQGLCWVELRGCYIGGDLDVSRSQLVCAPEDTAFRNSPHARYALDLRGSRIMGRLSMNVPKAKEPRDLKQEADAKQETEIEREPDTEKELVRFTALGGVSIVRCYIGGSVCGSGARLVAVEGNAFTAQRAEIKGHVFLDYSSEGWRNWVPFEARGFIDLNDVKIGSSLQMSGASLLRDHLSRAGLVVSGAQIADKCWLCGIEQKKINRYDVDTSPYPKFYPFYSAGGVNLSRTTICGELDMRGAFLDPSSWNTSLYAPSLVVHGDAKLTAFPGSHNLIPFRSNGILKLVSAHFFMKLDLRGAKLNFPEEGRDTTSTELPADLDWRGKRGCVMTDEGHKELYWEKALDARQLQVEGTILCSPAKYEVTRPVAANAAPLRFESNGSVDLQGARIAGRVEMSGAKITTTLATKDALNLSRVQVYDKVNLRVYTSEDLNQPWPFEAVGTLDLRHAHITTELNLEGASLERPLVILGEHSDKTPKYEKLRTIWADAATITSIEMEACRSTGSISMTGLNCSNGIQADGLKLTNGRFDLWQSCLGYISLKDFTMHGTPLKEDLHPGEQGVDVLQFNNVTIKGKLLIGMNEGSIQHPFRDEPKFKDYPFPYANLRELKVGVLEDGGGLGWSPWLRLKLEGFRCERAPVRRLDLTKLSTYTQQRRCIRRLEKLVEKSSKCSKLEQMFLGKRSQQYLLERRERSIIKCEKKAEALGIPHIHFLNLQYQKPRPSIIEFTSSAYDRLAESLRFDGHDREAKRVLSAKLDVKGTVDTPPVASLFWKLFKWFFDYGLSSRRTLGTLMLCLLLGTCFWWCSSQGVWVPNRPVAWYGPEPMWQWQNGNSPIPWADLRNVTKWQMDWHLTKGQLVYVKSMAPTEVVGGKAEALAKAESSDVHTHIKMANDSHEYSEVSCEPLGLIDSALYAVDSFVPILDRLRPAQCEISPEDNNAVWWRLGRTAYSVLGWIVTSITLLTLPGFLRKSAEE